MKSYKKVFLTFKTGDMEIYTLVRYITLLDETLTIIYERGFDSKTRNIPVDSLSNIEVKEIEIC